MLRVLKSNLVNLVTYVWRKLNRSGRSCLELKTLPRSGYISPSDACQKLFSISQSVLHIYDVGKRNDIPKVIAFLFCIHKNTNQQHESSPEEMFQPPTHLQKSANIIIRCHSLLFFTFTTTYNKWRGRKHEMKFDRQMKNLPRTN